MTDPDQLREAIRAALETIQMQQKIEDQSFHMPARTVIQVWNHTKRQLELATEAMGRLGQLVSAARAVGESASIRASHGDSPVIKRLQQMLEEIGHGEADKVF